MQITIELPDGIAQQFGDSPTAAGRSLVENALIEQYREGAVSIGQLARLLDLSRWEVEDLLNRHGGVQPYTTEMLAEDRRAFADETSVK